MISWAILQGAIVHLKTLLLNAGNREYMGASITSRLLTLVTNTEQMSVWPPPTWT